VIDYSTVRQAPFSFLSKGSKIQGKIQIKGPCHLSSFIDGELISVDPVLTVIELEGKVKGQVHVHDLEVYGTIEGEIFAKGKVTLFPTAKVVGKIQANSLVVHAGALVEILGHTLEP
jgi:cytoskeletal protein CcmA (bactofilin family)